MPDGPSFQALNTAVRTSLFVDASKHTDKPVLVLFHGFMMSRAIWNENLKELSENFRLVRIEWPGHGRAGSPEDKSAYQVDSLVQSLETIRKALGTERWSICAHSFGAGLAIIYALQHPEHVNSIVITNSRSALGALEGSRDDLERLWTALLTHGHDAIEKMPAHPRFMKNIPEDLKSELLSDAKLIDPTGIAMLLKYTSPATNVRNRLGDLKVPLMLTNGLRERGFQHLRQQLQVDLSHIQIVDIDAGHSPNAEAPAAFNAVTSEFLKTHSL